jgi:hypothetical protein
MSFWKCAAVAVLLTFLAGIAACGSEPAAPMEEPMAEEAPAAAEEPMATGPRVFFIEPQDGATVGSTVTLRFGVENYDISAVPTTVDQVRPGIGHHHVAIDSSCLPAGTVIEKAAPWVHFGDGSNEIEMQLPPGEHTLTLQLGDDAHTTIEGLCETITVHVEG